MSYSLSVMELFCVKCCVLIPLCSCAGLCLRGVLREAVESLLKRPRFIDYLHQWCKLS